MRRGFTLVELIFVIVILGLLSAIAAKKLLARREDAQAIVLASQFRNLVKDLQGYYITNGSLNNELSAMSDIPYIRLTKNSDINDELEQEVQRQGWAALYSDGTDGSYQSYAVGSNGRGTTKKWAYSIKELPQRAPSSIGFQSRELAPKIIIFTKSDKGPHPCLAVEFLGEASLPSGFTVFGAALDAQSANSIRVLSLSYNAQRGQPGVSDWYSNYPSWGYESKSAMCNSTQRALRGETGAPMRGTMPIKGYKHLFTVGSMPWATMLHQWGSPYTTLHVSAQGVYFSNKPEYYDNSTGRYVQTGNVISLSKGLID